MKKAMAFLLTILLTVGVLAACGTNSNPQSQPISQPETSAVASSASESTEQQSADTMTPAEKIMAETTQILEKQLEPLPEMGKNEKIGVLIISVTNPFWSHMQTCYEAAGKELGIQVEVMAGTTEGDTASQLDALMTMATKDYDAIILSPIEGSNLIPGIVQCNQNGIPVINLGPGVDVEALEAAGGHLDGRITVAFDEQGRMAANDMMNRLPDGGQVAIIQGLSGAAQSEGRTAGAKEAFESDAKFEVVAIQPCNWDATLAYDATKDLLVANPELKGIFACNDVMALAVVEALKAEGREDVMVYGIDFTVDGQASIQNGELMGSVTYSSAVYTRAALLMGMKIAQGQEIDKPVYCPLTLVTQDNVGDFDGWK